MGDFTYIKKMILSGIVAECTMNRGFTALLKKFRRVRTLGHPPVLYLYHKEIIRNLIVFVEVLIMLKRFLFWLRRDSKARNCRSLCVTCIYYDACRSDGLGKKESC